MPVIADSFPVEPCLPSVAVTAVSVLQNNQVIAALSSYLVNLCSSVQIKLFKHQAIHVLSPSRSFVLCCGGRSVCLVDTNEMTIVQPERRLSDWVVCAQWCHDDDDNIAVLFSYNSVSLLSSKGLESLRTVNCNSSCIVYGGCLLMEGSELVCCSGTVFNEPLLWKPFSEQKGKVIMAYTGHSGVIFDIKVTKTRLYTVSDDRTLIIWDRFDGTMLNRLYGHTARVLKVCLVPELGCVATVGEDNQCVLWSEETGLEVNRYMPHSGNGIRSVACNNRFIVTGGWDSSVVELQLPSNAGAQVRTVFTSSLELDPPKWVSWLSASELLVQLESGQLRIYNNSLESFSVAVGESQSRFKCYSKFCRVRDTTIIGGITGELCLLENTTKKVNYVESSKVSKIFSLTTVTVSNDLPSQFLCCQESGIVTLYFVSHDSLKVVPVSSYILPKSRNRWVTAAFSSETHLIIGDRRGGVHLYDLVVAHSQEPLSSIPGLHGENGISQISIYQDLLTTIGRDGNIRFFKTTNKTLTITKKEKLLPGVHWIEKLDSTSYGTVAYYFHAQCFKATILETGETFLSIECGGGHRSWDVLLSKNTVHFVYINSPNVNIVEQSTSVTPFTRHGCVNHGSDIHSAVYIDNTFITASEDCSLIVHSSDSTRKVSGHISSVRCLCALDNGTVFSAGARGSLKVWIKPPDRPDLELICDYSVVSDSHISVGYNSSYKFDKRNPDNDQRVISIDCCVSYHPLYTCFVLCGLSNGHVYLLGFTPKHTFTQVLSDYQTNCITRVILVSVEETPSSQTLSLVSTTTFGMVHVMWVQDCTVTGKFAERMHKSGVNGLDVRINGSTLEILTVGDDGDVTRSTLCRPSSLRTLACRTVHFSAGISAKFLNPNYIVSVGSDQRLFVMNLSLKPVYCCYVDVPDPHDLVLSSDTHDIKVLVFGKGYQEFHISADKIR